MSAIGIDFGTTNFRVGVYGKKRFEIICNEQGKPKTPCYVARVGQEWIVGDAAKRRALEDVENVAHSPKQLIGRSYEKLMELKEKRGWHFELVKDESGIAKVKFKGEERPLSSLELAARLFCEVKNIERQLQPQKIEGAVIAVPACFTPEQKESIVIAAQIAGIKVLDIIDETWAAALAYKDESEEEEENIVVLSVGGGSYDVAAFELKDEIKPLHTEGKGNAELGGQDFDAALFDKKWERATVSESDKQGKYLLLQECIKEKEMFADRSKTNFCIEKTNTEEIESECFQRFPSSKRLLEAIKHDLQSITDLSEPFKVVLVGGSTRLKCIHECAQVCFPNHIIYHILDVDEAVVQGAALHARNVVDQRGKKDAATKNAQKESSRIEEELNIDEALIQAAALRARSVVAQRCKGNVEADESWKTDAVKQNIKEVSAIVKQEWQQNEMKLERNRRLYQLENSIYDTIRTFPDEEEQCKAILAWINENRATADIEAVEQMDAEFSKLKAKIASKRKNESETKEVRSNGRPICLDQKTEPDASHIIQTRLPFRLPMWKMDYVQVVKIGRFTYLSVANGKWFLCWNTSTGLWTIQDYQYSNFTMVAFSHRLLLLGGCLFEQPNGMKCFKDVFYYNNEEKTLVDMQPMLESRAFAAATTHGNLIIVAGGHNESEFLSSVEILDLNTKNWSMVSLSLPSLCYPIKHTVMGEYWYLSNGQKCYSLPFSGALEEQYKCETLPDIPQNCTALGGINGHLIAVGTTIQDNSCHYLFNYNECSRSWNCLEILPCSPSNHTCTFLVDDTMLYLFRQGEQTDILIYDILPLLTQRYDLGYIMNH